MKFIIETMSCGGCVSSITAAIKTVDASAVVTADLDTHEIEVDTLFSEQLIRDALDATGYPASER